MVRPDISDYFAAVKTGRSKWWHWLVGAALIVAFYFLCNFIVVFAGYAIAGDDFMEGLSGYAFLAVSFLPLFFGLFLVQKYWHKRPGLALLTSARRFRWGHFWRGILAVVIVITVSLILTALFFPEDLEDLTLNPNIGWS